MMGLLIGYFPAGTLCCILGQLSAISPSTTIQLFSFYFLSLSSSRYFFTCRCTAIFPAIHKELTSFVFIDFPLWPITDTGCSSMQ